MPYVTVINTLPRPVQVNEQGSQLGGQSWGAVDENEPRVKQAISAGQLQVIEKSDTANPDLQAIFAETDRLNAAEAKLEQANAALAAAEAAKSAPASGGAK